ncbi:MAG: hypothetical protein K0U98_20840 [Deltaproteobacteria bacterium]|nr:hypothetical protein [Deltaproteobacteria bacterium]
MSWPEPPTEAPIDSSVDSWLKQNLEGEKGAAERVVQAALSTSPVAGRPWRSRLVAGFALLFLFCTLALVLGPTVFRKTELRQEQRAEVQLKQASGFSPEVREAESFLIDNKGDVVTITAASGQVRAIVMGRNP